VPVEGCSEYDERATGIVSLGSGGYGSKIECHLVARGTNLRFSCERITPTPIVSISWSARGTDEQVTFCPEMADVGPVDDVLSPNAWNLVNVHVESRDPVQAPAWRPGVMYIRAV
jgi:hypothetical protein